MRLLGHRGHKQLVKDMQQTDRTDKSEARLSELRIYTYNHYAPLLLPVGAHTLRTISTVLGSLQVLNKCLFTLFVLKSTGKGQKKKYKT